MRLLLLSTLFFFSSAHAQDLPNNFLDIDVGFGNYNLTLKFLNRGAKVPHEGYLLQAHDIAVLKVDLDSYKEDCEKIVHEASLSCIQDLKQCSQDAKERQLILTQENLNLIHNLETTQEKLNTQVQKTWLYSLLVGISATSITAVYFIL